MSSNCIFCKIISGEIPSKKIYEDETVMAFDDISPQAPVHFLVIPKTHIPTLDDVEEPQADILAKMMLCAAQIARDRGIADSGYRQVVNCKEHGGQVVAHLHLHILGGRLMGKMG